MAKFKSTFTDYSNDLVSIVGMAMNSLIRKIAEEQGAKPIRSTFLKPETATPEWLRQNIEWQVAVALFQRPNEKRTVNDLARQVSEVYREMIEEWIEENKANLAEIGFLFSVEDTDPNVITTAPPAVPFAPVALPPPAVATPPGPAPKITGFICRRGKR